MRNKVIIIFLIGVFISFAWAEEKAKEPPGKHHLFNFSIYYPLSINKSKNDSVNLNLSLVYGHVGRVNGIDLAAFGSVVEDDLRGIQLTGLVGVVGDSMKGIQASGLFSVAGDRSAGIQASGLFSVTGDDFRGIQASGLFSIVGDHFKGVQAAGLFSIVGENFKGIQGSGLFSIVGESFSGIQVGTINVAGETMRGLQAGVLNVVGENCRGMQVGALNFSDTISGLQVGVVNLGMFVKGAQIGIVNVSDRIDGIPFGLVNLSREHGKTRWVSWGSNITAVNTGLKMMVKNIYSIVSFGGINLEKDIHSSLSYGFHYGVHFPRRKTFFDVDLGYVNIDNEKYFKAVAGNIDHHLLEARGIFGIDISGNFSIFAGAGIGYMIDHYESFDSGKLHPVFFAGIELFNIQFLPER
jgi:hypothetical protein